MLLCAMPGLEVCLSVSKGTGPMGHEDIIKIAQESEGPLAQKAGAPGLLCLPSGARGSCAIYEMHTPHTPPSTTALNRTAL
jgi:hypothetical protein